MANDYAKWADHTQLELVEEIERLEAEIDRLCAAHEYMAKSYRIMQREKEHGWAEAEKHEAKLQRVRTDRDDVRGALKDIQALADRWAKYLTDPDLEDHERQVITDLHTELTGIVDEVIDGGDTDG